MDHEGDGGSSPIEVALNDAVKGCTEGLMVKVSGEVACVCLCLCVCARMHVC